MTSVSSLGFLRTRLDERLSQLQDDYRAIYGSDIQIEASDIDGELLAIFSERLSDLDQLAEQVYNGFNPNAATGNMLSTLVRLNGIKRLAGVNSTADITVTGTQGTIIPAGSLVQSTVDNTTWELQGSVTLTNTGTATVSAKCTTADTILAAPGTLTKIATPIYGWQTATNASQATPGRKEETDEQLRIRRRLATGTPGQSILDAIYGSITNLVGVRLSRVFENPTDVVDGNGMPPHSIYCVVEGGTDADIAKVIYTHKTVGATMVGSTTVSVADSSGLPHTVKFSRPTKINAYITVNVKKLYSYPTDGAQRIKDALTAYGLTLNIGDDLLDTRLYTPVNTVPNHYIESIYIGTSPSPSTDTNLDCPFDQLISIDPSRITVVES